MIGALAAAAVFHGVPRLLVEHDAEEKDEGTLGWRRESDERKKEKVNGPKYKTLTRRKKGEPKKQGPGNMRGGLPGYS